MDTRGRGNLIMRNALPLQFPLQTCDKPFAHGVADCTFPGGKVSSRNFTVREMGDGSRESAFERAGRLLDVPAETVFVWVWRRKKPGAQRLSQFEGGHKHLPPEWLAEFLEDRLALGREAREIVLDVVRHIERELNAGLQRLPEDLRGRFADHLKRQVSIVLEAAASDPRAGSGSDIASREPPPPATPPPPEPSGVAQLERPQARRDAKTLPRAKRPGRRAGG